MILLNPICLASIDGNAHWPAVAGECLADKAFGSAQFTLFAQTELNGITIAIDGAVSVQPVAFELDVRLIKVPFACDLTLPPIETFKQFGG